ncbi:MAG: arginase family protein [Chloroflexota bacterium]
MLRDHRGSFRPAAGRSGADLIWFDAHGDFNTWETSPSGFLGGMPLAMAVGRGEQTLLEATGMQPWPEEKVFLTDARDLDPGERDLVEASSVRHLTQITDLLNEETLPPGPLYIHFDTDVIDPADAPAMNYPAPGGPSTALVREVFQRLAATDRVVAVSVSLWEPSLDRDGSTRQTILDILPALLDQ